MASHVLKEELIVIQGSFRIRNDTKFAAVVTGSVTSRYWHSITSSTRPFSLALSPPLRAHSSRPHIAVTRSIATYTVNAFQWAFSAFFRPDIRPRPRPRPRPRTTATDGLKSCDTYAAMPSCGVGTVLQRLRGEVWVCPAGDEIRLPNCTPANPRK